MSLTHQILCLKKYLALISITLVFISKSASATSEGTSISVGGLTWYSIYNPISRIGGRDVPNTSSDFMSGITIKAQHSNFFGSLTYLLSTNSYQLVVTDHPVRIHHSSANSSASRNDVDISVGYMINPIIFLNTGYKGIFVDDTITLTSQGGTSDAKRFAMYNLGKIGVGTDIPFWARYRLMINGNALVGAYHNDVSYPDNYNRLNTPDDDFVAWGGSVETTLSYAIFDSFLINIGLYGQYTKAGSDNSSFFGPSAGIDYKF